MIKHCLEHWRDIRTCPGTHYLPMGNRRRGRGLIEELLDDDDDDDDLGDGEGWAEVVGGTGGGGANK